MPDKDRTRVIITGANGRMGKTLVNLVLANANFELAGTVELKDNLPFLSDLPGLASDDLETILKKINDAVIIDFSNPKASMANAAIAAQYRMPAVIGTTGFDSEELEQLTIYASRTPILWSANMSVGVNVLLHYLPLLAKALGEQYDMEIVETHHKHKKDAPSGTALMLAKALAKARDWDPGETVCTQRSGIIGERPQNQIGVMAVRGGDVVGVHDCYFFGPGEIIEIRHTAESRENFAQGALRAAAWLRNRKSGKLYSMLDVIEI